MLRFRLLFLIALFMAFTAPVEAQRDDAGIGLSPAIIEFAAEPGETYQQSFTVSNLSNSTATYYLYLRDIVNVQAGGAPVFATEGQEKTGFELSEWVTLETTEVTIPGNGEQTVTMEITVPLDTSPGSHFGGVFVSAEPPRIRTVGAAVAYEVANIISIRVAGDAIIDAAIREFTTGDYIYSRPDIDFNAVIENQGNVLVRPVGPLEITNMYGREVANLTFNESQAGVFPGREREFAIRWTEEGTGFGRYEARLTVQYGEPGAYTAVTSVATFWILPSDIILPALGVLAVLLLVTYVSVRLYIRNKIAAASVGSRRLVRRGQQRGMPLALLITVVMMVVTALFLLVLLILFA